MKISPRNRTNSYVEEKDRIGNCLDDFLREFLWQRRHSSVLRMSCFILFFSTAINSIGFEIHQKFSYNGNSIALIRNSFHQTIQIL
ncbi:hypothetical protein HZS_1778 [Henneguya salminicola]|nr:hypothetical protein HZS_1778 [Henneguya salminicola]